MNESFRHLMRRTLSDHIQTTKNINNIVLSAWQGSTSVWGTKYGFSPIDTTELIGKSQHRVMTARKADVITQISSRFTDVKADRALHRYGVTVKNISASDVRKVLGFEAIITRSNKSKAQRTLNKAEKHQVGTAFIETVNSRSCKCAGKKTQTYSCPVDPWACDVLFEQKWDMDVAGTGAKPHAKEDEWQDRRVSLAFASEAEAQEFMAMPLTEKSVNQLEKDAIKKGKLIAGIIITATVPFDRLEQVYKFYTIDGHEVKGSDDDTQSAWMQSMNGKHGAIGLFAVCWTDIANGNDNSTANFQPDPKPKSTSKPKSASKSVEAVDALRHLVGLNLRHHFNKTGDANYVVMTSNKETVDKVWTSEYQFRPVDTTTILNKPQDLILLKGKTELLKVVRDRFSERKASHAINKHRFYVLTPTSSDIRNYLGLGQKNLDKKSKFAIGTAFVEAVNSGSCGCSGKNAATYLCPVDPWACEVIFNQKWDNNVNGIAAFPYADDDGLNDRRITLFFRNEADAQTFQLQPKDKTAVANLKNAAIEKGKMVIGIIVTAIVPAEQLNVVFPFYTKDGIRVSGSVNDIDAVWDSALGGKKGNVVGLFTMCRKNTL